MLEKTNFFLYIFKSSVQYIFFHIRQAFDDKFYYHFNLLYGAIRFSF